MPVQLFEDELSWTPPTPTAVQLSLCWRNGAFSGSVLLVREQLPMPVQSLTPCAEPGCPTLVPHGRCAKHQQHGPPAHGWGAHGTTRLRGRRLQRAREQLFTREPLCRVCREHGRTTRATVRDHIVPLAEGGTDAPSNIQPLCQACSNTKTHQESARGKR